MRQTISSIYTTIDTKFVSIGGTVSSYGIVCVSTNGDVGHVMESDGNIINSPGGIFVQMLHN